MTDHDVLDLLPLYALDALEVEEIELVESHLERCADCLTELGRHHTTAGELVGDVGAPTHLWARIHAEIEAGRASVSALDESRVKSPGWMWIASVAAAAALVLGVLAVVQSRPLRNLAGPEAIVAAAAAAADIPGTTVNELEVDGTTIARIVLTPSGEGFLLPGEIDPLGADRTYQLWVLTPDELVISAGVFGPVLQPGRFTWTEEVAGFALTREVAGGVVSSAGDVVAVAEL